MRQLVGVAHSHIHQALFAFSSTLRRAIFLAPASQTQPLHHFAHLTDNPFGFSVDVNLALLSNGRFFCARTHLGFRFYRFRGEILILLVNLDTLFLQFLLELSNNTVCTSIIPDDGVTQRLPGGFRPT